jgi:L-aspartate oxidase
MNDTLIIGCGIAGAAAALRLSQDRQRHITIITRAPDPLESNSSYAQGGIVTRGTDDSAELLIEDIINAGDGLTWRPAAEQLAEEGPQVVRELLIERAQVPFDHDEWGKLLYGLEAAHSRRRILHVGDATGTAIMKALMPVVLAQPNITVLSDHTAVDLITFPHHAVDAMAVYGAQACHGAYVLDNRTGEVTPILAAQTILATGGLGQIYSYTSNPNGSRGDGLAMAHRAGARTANLEFVQFHPTTLHMPGVNKLLISEAVRGEGGILLTPDGEPFMARYAPEWKDLAPRDEVARAIYWEMLHNGYPYVLLDIASKMPAAELTQRFPQIYAGCLKLGIDITRQPIPVQPGAHYFCGGVLVNLDGQTSIPNLYAIGEVSCTGLHGANRLASTSLLEGLVWGDRAARHIQQAGVRKPIADSAVPAWDTSGLLYDTDPALMQGDMTTIRTLNWHYVGLVRSRYLLGRAINELRHLSQNIEDFYRKTRLTDQLIGLRNSAQVSLLIAQSAIRNRKSQGCHYREDK